MLVRLRQVILAILALVLGFVLGSGPFAEWAIDLSNMFRMAWSHERVARGPSGTVPLLVAGFLLGQGLFLCSRQIVARVGPARARRVERLASWDPAVQLGTRFGLHQYIEQCTAWSLDDPTARTQTLALFKLRGLGKLNDRRGTLATTQLLQRIAVELRSASLPESVSAVRRWIAHYFPRPSTKTLAGLPAPRFPARWSGATFALAFRELDALQAVTIVRNVAAWIRHEIAALEEASELTLTVSVAVGSAGTTGRGLASVAARAIAVTPGRTVVALLDPADMRAEAIAQLNGVEAEKVSMPQALDVLPDVETHSRQERAMSWMRSWGSAVGCLVGAFLLLAVTSGKPPASNTFPWPENLRDVQIVDSAGPRRVRLIRSAFSPQSTANWSISDALLIQGNTDDGPYYPVQVHVTVTNKSPHKSYVSSFDFLAIDKSGRPLPIDALRTLRLSQGLSGIWLRSEESWSGWLVTSRAAEKITGLRFEPDRGTLIELANPDADESS